MFRFAAFALGLTLCLATPVAADDYRLGSTVTPTMQFVDLKIDPMQKGYSGLTRVTLQISKQTEVIRLHAEDIEISKTRLDGPSGTIPLKLEKAKDKITLRAPRTLEPGTYTLTIDFKNEFNTHAVGLYRMEAEGRGYAFTQFEAIDARKAFPCWDEPGFKQPFQLRLTVKESDEAVSNTPIARTTHADGWKTIDFGTTKPLPVYLIAIAVGPMDSVPVKGLSIPGRIYTPRGQAKLATLAASLVAPILTEQERWFGMKYPYEKLDLIAIPEYWPGAMEHPGAVTFADTILLLDPERASPNQRKRLVQTVAHELAHMWFGDLVTMKWWDELWLNESFADWFGDKTTETLFPEYQHQLAELQQGQEIMFADARLGAEAIRKPVVGDVDLLGDVGLAYDKGKAVLSMFEAWLGPEVFRAGVKRYLNDHAWGNATANDFFAALTKSAKFDVAPAMSDFLDQPGIPLVEVRLFDKNHIVLSQRRLANAGSKAPAQRWMIPVALRYSDGNKVSTKTLLFTEDSLDIVLVPEGRAVWVMPLADGIGYYRWNLDPSAMLELAKNAQRDLTPAERIAFLGNLRALLDAGIVRGDDYLRAVHSFASDPEPRVVDSVINSLDRAKLAFVTNDLEPAFATWVRGALRPSLDRIGLERRAGEPETVSILRPDLIRWLGMDGGDPEVIAWCASTTKSYMNDPRAVDPSVAATALAVTARSGDEALFDAMAAKFAAAATPGERAAYLGAMGAFRSQPTRSKALELALKAKLRPNETFTIPFGGFDSPAGRDETYRWFTANYDTIASRIPQLYLPFLVGIAGGCEEERLVAARKFFSDPKRSVEGTEKQLEKTEESVRDCVGLRKREGAHVADYLRAPAN